MYCRNCGTKLEEGAKFCPNCGQSTQEPFNMKRGEQEANNQEVKQEEKVLSANVSAGMGLEAVKHRGFWSVGRLVVGILSILMFCGIILQSCVVGVGNTLMGNQDSGGTQGLLTAIAYLSAGIVGIATRNSRSKGGPIAAGIIYWIGAVCTIGGSTVYGDLMVWGVLASLLGLMFMFCAIRTGGSIKDQKRMIALGISAVITVGLIALTSVESDSKDSYGDIGEALGRANDIAEYLEEYDYQVKGDGSYESPDGQVRVVLDEEGFATEAEITGESTALFGLYVGQTFRIEDSDFKNLSSHGYELSDADDTVIVAATNPNDTYIYDSTIQLSLDHEKITNILYKAAKKGEEDTLGLEENISEGTEGSEGQSIREGGYIYDDGSSIYSTAEVKNDGTGLRIDINAMGYGGHQQGLSGGYLTAEGNGTYSCTDENGFGTFTLTVNSDGFTIVPVPAEGMETMYNSIAGTYVYYGAGSAPEFAMETGEYILPTSDTAYLTDADVAGLSKEQIRLAINEIYARHGRIFEAEDLNQYFSSQSWYTPLYTADEFTAMESSLLNDYEKANIQFLAAVRDGAGSTAQSFQSDWLYGTYEIHSGYLDAAAEVGFNSGDGTDYLLLNGATPDGSAMGEFYGVVTANDGRNGQAADEYGNVISFYYNGVDTLEITDSTGSALGGMNFPGFSGTYQKTADLSMNAG